MRYPNDIQAAVLFDRWVTTLDAMVRDFMRIEQTRTGAAFNVPEAKPGVFYRLFGAGELMVTFEYLDHPADPAVFRASLGSAVTGLLCPDIRERLMRSRSHVLINISHGVLGGVADDPKIGAMLPRAAGSPRLRFGRRGVFGRKGAG